jgi:hypothetical protein
LADCRITVKIRQSADTFLERVGAHAENLGGASGVGLMQGRSEPGGRLVRKEAISETPDADLVAEAQAGDAPAFGHLVRRHAPIAKRMAVLWGAGSDADDVVQEAFVKAYGALPRFRGEAFRAWLLSIVHNETRNLHRSRGRRVARESMA